MRKTILITGAEGFTGRYLTAALAEAGHEVHGLVRSLPETPIVGAIKVHACDLGDRQGLSKVVEDVSPHQVAHLAAIAFVAHNDVDAIYRTNIVGTRNLLEVLAAATAPPESVLLASSANVYGNGTEGVLSESSQLAPANDYAVSKLAMEFLAKLYASRLPIIISRPFNYTGVGQSESFLLPKIVAHVRSRAAVIELGNLDVARDFSDVRVVAEAYGRLLQTRAAVGQTFNICSGRAYTLNEVLEIARAISGHDFDVRVNPAFVRQNEVKTLLGSRANLEACIGPLAPVDLSETLRWMLQAPSSAPTLLEKL